MEWQRELLLALVGALGFALIFNVRKQLIFPASFGGVLCWGMYLLCVHFFAMNSFYAALMASACTALYAEFVARILGTPATGIYIPSIVPLIPGSGLYYMMSSVVQQQWLEATHYGVDTLNCVLGIGAGMSVVCAPFEMWGKVKQYYRMRLPKEKFRRD